MRPLFESVLGLEQSTGQSPDANMRAPADVAKHPPASIEQVEVLHESRALQTYV